MNYDIPYLDLHPHDPSLFHIRPLRSEIPTEPEAHRHNFQEILWVEAGHGRHQIDQLTLDIQENTLYLIAKGQVHRFLQGSQLQGYLIRFTDDFLHEATIASTWNYRMSLFSQEGNYAEIQVPDTSGPNLRALLNLLWQEQQNTVHDSRSDILRHLLLAFLLKIERLRSDPADGPNRSSPDAQRTIYTDFLRHVEANYRKTHFVADYANALGISARQLSRICQHFSGRTAKQVINERLVLDAKRYLHHTHHSIKEISYLLGYKDPSYFSRIFRRYTAVSPKDYRDQKST